MSEWRRLAANLAARTWQLCHRLYVQIADKISGASTPESRLRRSRQTLQKQMEGAGANGQRQAWQTYQRALPIAMMCDRATLARFILDFDSRFNAPVEKPGLAVGQAISYLLEAVPQTSQNIEAVWQLSKRIIDLEAQQTVQQQISLQCAAAGESNLLLSQLLNRYSQGTISPSQIADIISRFLLAHTFQLSQAWKSFFEQLSPIELPKIHQVYALIGQEMEAADFAEAAGDYSAAASYLEPLAGKDMALWRLRLLEDAGDESGAVRTHQAIADIFWQEERYASALEHAQAADNLEQASNCHQKLGDFSAAIDCRPEFSDSWIQEIRTLIKAISREKIAHQSFLETVDLLKSVQAVWHRKHQDSEVEWTKYLLLGAIRTARDTFASELQTCEESQKIALFKRWSLLEEGAENYHEAALKAEAAKDYFEASVLFEKADAFGQALAVLETNPTGVVTPERRAQLAESGGDFFTAAEIYEQLEDTDKAVELYAQAGEYWRAAMLRQRQIGDDEALFDDRFKALLAQAGRAEYLAEMCAAKARTPGQSAEEKAQLWRRVRALAEKGLIAQRWLDVVISELPAIEKSGRLRFQQQASDWMKMATQEVLENYTDAIGLDLGTSNSVVCLYNKTTGELEVAKKHRQSQIPSVFAVDQSGKELIGVPIPKLLAKSPRAIITKAKRMMGTAQKYKIGEKTYRPEEISARLITYAREFAREYLLQKVADRVGAIALEATGTRPPADWIETQLKAHPPAIPLSRSVITVPAYFNEAQKQATKDASLMAGAQTLRLVHEPTAACLAQCARTDKTQTILVADLGAGTFDLSVIEAGEGVFEVREIEGNNALGSADVDDLMYAHFNTLIQDKVGRELPYNSQAATRLRQACEELKIELSTQREWQINLRYLIDQQDFELSLTRLELEKIATSWLQRIKTTCQKIQHKPDLVLLIGGGGMMPAVRQTLEEVYHTAPSSAYDPTTVVARGAALQAAILLGDATETLLIDVVPFSLGIKCRLPNDTLEFSSVIDKHTTIPTDRTRCYSTVKDNQKSVKIEVFQGESRVPEDNFKVGQFVLSGIPVAKAGVPKIDVTFSIDKDCLLTVTARDQGTQTERSITIADSHLLTPAQMSSLKSQFQRSQQYQKSLAKLSEINQQLNGISLSIEQINILDLSTRLKESVQRYELNRSLYAPTNSDNSVLAEMYRERDTLAAKTQLAIDQWDTLSRSTQQWLADHSAVDGRSQSVAAEISQLLKAGEALLERGQTAKENMVEFSGCYQKWLGVMTSLPVNIEGSGEAIAQHLLSLQRYAEALEHVQQLPKPLSVEQIELTLEILAGNRNRQPYMTLLAQQAQTLNLHKPDLNELNQTVKIYARSVVLIQVNLGNRTSSGSGFAISPTQIATNRHVLVDPANGRCANPPELLIVTQSGTRRVTAIHQLDSIHDDVAILTVEPSDIPLVPLRLGFSELVEVGERIITVGFPNPENASFSDNFYCNTGLINRIRAMPDVCSERVLEISTPLRGGISGAPIFNQLGEVVGLSTFWQERQQAVGGRTLSEKAFYAIPVGLLRRLQSEIG